MNIFNQFSKLFCRIVFNHSFFIKREHNYKKIIFDFDHINKFNLGDTLFFIPLLYELNKNKKVLFEVKATLTQRSIIDFFIKDITYSNNSSFNDEYLIIRSINLFNFFDYLKNKNIVYFDTTSKNINEPISKFIINSFFELFGIDKKIISFSFLKKIDKTTNSKKILFSDEVNSGFFRLNKSHYISLYNIVEQYYNMGFKIYRVGSEHKFSKFIKFEYINLEKRSDLKNFIQLISSKTYYRIIAFDTFIAHLGCVFEIDTHIVMRNFNRRYTKRLKSFYFPIIENSLKKNIHRNVSFH